MAVASIFKLVDLARSLSVRSGRKWISGIVSLGIFIPLAPNRASAATHEVRIVDFEFVPSNLVVEPGDTVVWHADAPDHTVTADSLLFDSSPPPEVVTIPEGKIFSHTFTNVGIIPYYCRLHGRPVTPALPPVGGGAIKSVPDDAMMGIIRVADPSVNAPPGTPLNQSPLTGSAGVSNSPRLEASTFDDANSDDRHAASQWLVRITGETAFDSGLDAANLTQLRLADLDPGITYDWQVRYMDDRGAWSPYSSPTSFTVAESQGSGSGLMGTYFSYNAKRDRVKDRIGSRIDSTLDFDWALGKPFPGSPANNFLITWDGLVLPAFSETYRFRINADGGVRLWINGEVVIDDPVTTTFALYRSGTFALEGGIPAVIRIQYFDTKGNASMHLRWSSLSQPLEVIPQARLFPAL